MKTLRIILIFALLCTGTLHGWAQSGDFGTGNALHWKIVDSTLTISGTGAMPDYCGHGYTDIPWLEYCSQIESPVVEGGIGKFFLINQTIIEDGVTSIGGCSFWGCAGMISVSIPNSVTNIGESAFGYCTGLQTVTVNWVVPLTIGANVFSGVTTANIQLQVPKGKKTLYEAADVWKDFGSIVESGACIIAQGTTGDLSWVLDCDSTLTISGTGAMPDYYYTKDIPWFDIILRDQIKKVVIEEGVTSIGIFAFYGCAKLVSITIPNSVTSIGSYAFYVCGGLASVDIPDSVKSIGYYAFCGSGLTSVTIPKNVISIGKDAFWSCTSLASVYFNADSCVTMGSYDSSTNQWWPAFWETDNLHTLVIGNNVKNIPDFAFCGSGLQTVSIPDNVTNIGLSAFSECVQLTAIDVAATNPNYSSIAGVLFNKNKTTLLQCPAGKVGEYVIPATAETVGDHAFYGCNKLTAITISENIKTVGRWAFRNCSSLETVNFNAVNCTAMGYDGGIIYVVFGRCTSLHTLNIGSKVKNIPLGAFALCGSLTGELLIPNSVTSIGAQAFESCTGFTGLTIGNSVTSIGVGAFRNNTGLQQVKVLWDTNLDNSEIVDIANLNVFYGVDVSKVQLIVPCRTKQFYEVAPVWQDFIIEEADFSVNPGTTDVYFSWTPLPEAKLYTLTIYSDEARTVIVRIYTFDSEGNLTGTEMRSSNAANIAFDIDPDKFKCMVSGLLANTPYYYEMKVKDDKDVVINEETGGFKTLDVVTTISSVNNDANINIYPNPVSDNFRIEGIAESAPLTIIDINGKTVMQQTVHPNETVWVGNLNKGIYIVKVKGNTVKMLKQ